MSVIEFQPWPKIARLNRDIIVTEKIDGTNAAVVIVPLDPEGTVTGSVVAVVEGEGGTVYAVYAQSRTRFITPQQDNYGFARWVHENAEALVDSLGEGTHFGEWWGSGIQRKYGLTGGDKRFSLFNVKRWGTEWPGKCAGLVPGLSIVPVLYQGPFSEYDIKLSLLNLEKFGSLAAPGFPNPEGIVVFHTASRESYKVTLEGDEAPKGAAGHALDNERIAA